MVIKRWGKKGSLTGKKSGAGALVVIDGELLLVNGGEEVADEVWKNTTRSMAWSASLAAYCGGGEMRPEVLHGVGCFR
jgi:hypothetical protein